MNNLTKKEQLFIIIFYDGGTQVITKEQNDKIMQLSATQKKIIINSEFISFSSISRITELDKYEAEHKEKRKTYPAPDFSEQYLTKTIQNFSEKRRKRALESIIRGFKKYFNGREIPPQSQKVLNHFVKRVNKT